MLFSVIVPVYNIKEYIRRCLDSILSQDYSDYELLLVDDGSTDGSAEICDEYADNNTNTRVIHKKNGGLVSARNAGIAQAKGDYILYVDGDDRVAPNWLCVVSDCIDGAPERPDLVVFGSVRKYDDRDQVNLINTREGFYNRAQIEKEIFPRLLRDREQALGEAIFLPASWNKAFKRELLIAHHCFDESVRIGEDTSYVFEFILNANSLFVCKKVIYYYNKQNNTSILSKPDSNRIKKRFHLFEYVDAHLAGCNPVIDSQLNEFYASRIIYDLLYYNRKSDNPFKIAAFYKKELKETGILKFVQIRNIPLKAQIVIALLKLGMCRTVFLGLKLIGRK